MSQGGRLNISGGGGSGSPVQTLTGNTGGAVPPTANNINVVGATGITVTGNPGTSTLTISLTDVTSPYTNINTTPYIVNSTDYYLSVDTSGSAITIELPNAPTTYRNFIVKDRTGQAGAGHAITITTVGGALLIDGQPSFILDDSFDSINLIFNSSSYEIY